MRAALWDLDGLLLDTEPLYLEAEQAIMSRYVPEGDIRTLTHALLGSTAVDSARTVIAHFALPLSVDAYIAEREARLEALLPRAQLLPGVRRLSDHFTATGVRQAIATSSSRRLCSLKLGGSGATAAFFRGTGRFAAVVCGDEVKRGKPAPDTFLQALERLNDDAGVDEAPIQPWECVVFEDAPAGVRGALAAGMRCVAVANEHTPRGAYDGADLVLDSLEQLRPERVGFAPYRDATPE